MMVMYDKCKTLTTNSKNNESKSFRSRAKIIQLIKRESLKYLMSIRSIRLTLNSIKEHRRRYPHQNPSSRYRSSAQMHQNPRNKQQIKIDRMIPMDHSIHQCLIIWETCLWFHSIWTLCHNLDLEKWVSHTMMGVVSTLVRSDSSSSPVKSKSNL